MGVGLVDEEDAAAMGVQVGEDEQHLLEAAPGQSHVEPLAHMGLTVEQVDGAAGGLLGIRQLHPEQALHQARDPLPVLGGLAEHHEAKVAEHLGRLPLAEQHVDASGLEEGLLRLDARHRVQQLDIDAGRPLDEFRSGEGGLVRGAVDQLVPLVAEPHGHGLDLVLVEDPEGDLQLDVAVARANGGVVPEVPGPLHGDRDDVEPVEPGRRPLPGRRLALEVEPGADGLGPEGDGLDGRGLAAVVGADEDGRVVQLDPLLVAETLEVPDLQPVQQSHAGSPDLRRRRSRRGSSARRRASSGTCSSASVSASARTKPSA